MSIYPAFELYDVYNDQDILTTTDEINNSSGDSSFDSDLYVKKSGDTMYGQLVLPSIIFVDGSNQSTGFTTTLKQDLTETKAKTINISSSTDNTTIEKLKVKQIEFMDDNNIVQNVAITQTDKNQINSNFGNIILINEKLTNISFDTANNETVIINPRVNKIKFDDGVLKDKEFKIEDINEIYLNKAKITLNTDKITEIETEIDDVITTRLNTLDNKTQRLNETGYIVQGIVVAGLLNASAQELRINRINIYQQPVGVPELVVATLRAPTNKSLNDLELNTFDNDLTILSNQINIDCDIQFKDDTIQSTAFTDTLKQKVLDNETNISTNTQSITTNTQNIATNTQAITTLYQSLVPVGTIIMTAQPLTIAPPEGYQFCIGELKNQVGKYSALYALIGNTYRGNKASYTGYFYLPDLRQVYVKGSGQSNTYNVNSLATTTGQYQEQSIQQHKHDYELPANTNNVSSTSIDNRSVYDNTRITTQTTTLRDNNNIVIPSSLDETRPDTLSLNYLIKY